MTTENKPYWLAALHLPDTGPRTLQKCMQHFNDIKKLFNASTAELNELKLSEKQIQAIQHPDWEEVDRHLKWEEESGHTILTLEDARYPTLLKEIADPPFILFIKGNPNVLAMPQIAMVGSRHPSAIGLKNAQQFARVLAQSGYAVTSGLALGVDGACHRGSLDVNGVTIAVMGTGLNQLYPITHRALARSILDRGAIVSEFPLDTKPYASNFPRRNRLIAGLSLGVLVVEAAMKSGSLITAKYALEQGREVFAIPGSIHQPLAKGCHYLIRQGAKLVETAQDVIEETGQLHIFSQLDLAVKHLNPIIGENRLIYDHIGYEITPIDVIVSRAGLTAGEVSSILLLLELDGHIQSVPGGYIRTYAS